MVKKRIFKAILNPTFQIKLDLTIQNSEQNSFEKHSIYLHIELFNSVVDFLALIQTDINP